MGIATTRTRLGDHFSEGARLLWEAMDSHGWTQGQLTKAVDAKPGVVSRWLYGDTKPSWDWAEKLRDTLAIPLETWITDPTPGFVLPALRDSDSTRDLGDCADDSGSRSTVTSGDLARVAGS